MLRFHMYGFLAGCLAILSTGCCGVPGGPRGNCGAGGCAMSGGGRLASLASCTGGCGEVYVDEWISEPPVADNCGYDCGGCGKCGNCQPLRTALRLLWGRPFVTDCCPNPGSASCEAGCDTGGSMFHATSGQAGQAQPGCNCGGQHAVLPSTPLPIPYDSSQTATEYIEPTVSPQAPLAPSTVPTPAPTLPNSAKRLNPARRHVSTASTERQVQR